MGSSIIETLVEQDFGISSSNGRWGRSEEHSSLVIDHEKNLYYYNAKGLVGDALHYLINVRGMPFGEAKKYLKSLGYSTTVVYTVNADKPDVVAYPALVDAFFESGRTNREYWYNRQFTDNTIDRFQLGWYNDWYLIPIFFQGTFRNFQKRRDNPKKEIKSWYRGLSPLLYNSDLLKFTSKIIITEGPTDCIRLLQEGIPAISHNGGATNWSDEWFPLLLGQKEIVINLDNDPAGNLGAKKAAKIFGIYRTRIYTFKGFEPGYDVIDFFRDGGSKQEYLDLVDKEAKYLYELSE